jgi:antitoxin (DNA-binding transcriptional repressor) of toxin-antitoxin stability system
MVMNIGKTRRETAARWFPYHRYGEVKARLTIGARMGICRIGLSRRRHIDEVASGSYLLDMRSVGIKVLKNKLSEYVRLAAGGETVLVTDRDRVVAELNPPQPRDRKLPKDEFIAKGVREGWLTPAKAPPGGPLPRGKPVMSFEEMMDDLDESREDRYDGSEER